MPQYLIQGQTLTNIASAIREKTGASGGLFPEAMPEYIRSIQTGAVDTHGVPMDIVTEAERVASSVQSKKGSNAVTFIAMSDMHEMGDGDHADASIIERYRRANRNAGQGAKLISDMVGLDFFANLGDFAWGSATTTIADGVQSIRQAREYIADVVRSNESFITPGNHDTLAPSYSQNGDYLDHNVMAGLTGNYRYVDLDAKKVRVICLNTAEIEGASVTSSGNTERISGTQLQWFAEALDLSAKSDAAQWGIIILAHHPLDWGDIKPAANILAAYLEGTSYSVTHTGTAVSCDFTGKNAATVIAQFHGHVHGFRVDYINDLRSGTAMPTTVKRVAIPNACYARNNEYGQNSGTENNGIEFGEETTYNKSDNATGKNTAFCVVSVDLDAKIIYADCFGAGYDRIISYGNEEVVSYTVTNNLTNASTSNGVATVLAGAAYSALITADNGYELKSVTVTMGGVDITAEVYSGGAVYIEEVTGDVVITVTTVSAVVYDVTNLVATSQERTSTAVYNGIGYRNGIYTSESGDGTDAACVATGWIPYVWKPENVIYVRGAAITTSSHVRFYGYADKTAAPYDGAYATGDALNSFFTVEELEIGTYYKLTPLNTFNAVAYIRISLIGTGENLIITVKEPIVANGSGDGEDSGDAGDDTYTNLVPTAVATDGLTVFNGTGYEDGTYASVPHTGTDAACVTTGFLWLDSAVNAIYVKGATWDTSNNHCRIHVYSTLGSASGHAYETNATSLEYFTIETLGDNYYKFTITSDAVKDHWYCMSLVGTGENLIITHDSPIE